jgi:hypothetical protein
LSALALSFNGRAARRRRQGSRAPSRG